MFRIDRRAAIAVLAGPGTALAGLPLPATLRAAPGRSRLKQSVCKWCYPRMTVEELCREAKAIGLRSVELLDQKDWATPARFGLTCAMANGPSTIPIGFNRPDQHDRLVAELERMLPAAAALRIPNLIVFSGNRAGLSDGEGMEHCARGLRRIVPMAERYGVTLCMELLNSKVDHPDYQCDRTAWGVELARRVNSPRFRLLYDIYHMQIMEGDVIRTIRDHAPFLAHFHTGGVPGRHEIDDTQELNYRRIMLAIAETGFTGYVGQEFIPSREPSASLRQGFEICNVP